MTAPKRHWFHWSLLAFALVTSGVTDSLVATERNSDASWKALGNSWSTQPHKVKVIAGNELEISGIRCRLLGVVIPADAVNRDVAKRYMEAFIEGSGGYVHVANSDAPINDKDGVPLVWLWGNECWAQVSIVENRLANADFTGIEDYAFDVPAKNGRVQYDWKGWLLSAASAAKSDGKPRPNLFFKWPGQASVEISTAAQPDSLVVTLGVVFTIGAGVSFLWYFFMRPFPR